MSLRAWVGMLKLSATARLCCCTQRTLGARRRAYPGQCLLDSLRVAQELCEDQGVFIQATPTDLPETGSSTYYRAVMTEPRALITRRYSKVKGLRARGILSPASAPCEIDGCRNCSPLPDFRGHGTGYVYEHCHRHDYIRGVTCAPCNVQMTLMDARVETCATWPRFRAYLAWWLRCPACAAGPPWEPWLTADEYNDGPMLAELASLARTEPGSAARDQALTLLARHGRAIVERRRYRAREAKRAAGHAVLARLRAFVDAPPTVNGG
jgi:hypothetical protein